MSEPFLAEIRLWGFNFAPRGWAFCDGQLLQISQNTALFALVGSTFGGDGRSTFALPDLRGRAPVHPGQGPGLSARRWGEKGGDENVTLTEAQLPSHSHALQASSDEAEDDAPAGHVPAASEDVPLFAEAGNLVNMNAAALGNSGGGEPHANLQPYLALNFCIALTGIFPPRN
ncbi:MAG: phage tail protein [Pirellulaceae bacterium]|nr:phage tail protein [Pirellulaceae bacterium]